MVNICKQFYYFSFPRLRLHSEIVWRGILDVEMYNRIRNTHELFYIDSILFMECM